MNIKSKYPIYSKNELKGFCDFCGNIRYECSCFCRSCGHFRDFCICEVVVEKRKKNFVNSNHRNVARENSVALFESVEGALKKA